MILEYKARNFSQVLESVQNCSGRWSPRPSDPEELWFRGEAGCYSLLPGLYRPHTLALKYDEENLQERFRARGAPFVRSDSDGAWDWYFRAQHFGIPTRLLDWTDSLVVATYFALAPHIDTKDRRLFDAARAIVRARPIYDAKAPVVWVMDAGSLNRSSCGLRYDCVLAVDSDRTQLYTTEELRRRRLRNRYPIAILPPYTNERIIAQQGSFTLHGYEAISIDELARKRGSPIHLARIVIDRANVAHLWCELERLGTSVATLFPGLDSIAAATKWVAQFSN